MRNIAIIPARGGSKRIPRKNIKPFMGKPIIAYSIEAAFQSELFDEVMVSTDDEEIARVALQYGAKVPFMRSTANASDFAPLSDVVDEVIDHYEKAGVCFDNFCCILSTVPFLKPADLVDAYRVFIHSSFDTIRPVVKFSYPVQRSFKMSADGTVGWIFPGYENTRSQDLEPAYHDAGMFYMGKREGGLNAPNRGAIVIPEHRCQDIDTEEDWLLAEQKYILLKNGKEDSDLL